MKLISSKYLSTDLRSGLVVFLVALPLCLGIALASGAPLFSGIITGIIGGIVVGLLSNSQLSVSGPAAGLTAIVLAAIGTLGSFQAFLLAGVIAGIMQIVLGYLKAGIISNYLPSNVIEGMLAGIGIIIILTQLPHAVGYDVRHEGDFFYIDQEGKHPIFQTVIEAINYIHPGAMIVMLVSIAILISYNKFAFFQKMKAIPGALLAVLAGIIINEIFIRSGSSLAISQEHLVKLPVPASMSEFWSQFTFPDFTQVVNKNIWIVAATLAAVASIETLLCIEAVDKMDPLKRYTNTNRELKAQGIGNILSCMIGGLPMTSVIVRSSANVNAGGRTKLSAIFHGAFLLIAVLSIPTLLNKIPLASLAAVLIMIGYKLASPKVFLHMWNNSKKFQFIPFVVTVVAIVMTDLLTGVGIGLIVSVYFILRGNIKLAYYFRKDQHQSGETINIELAQEVSFLNKAAIKQTLSHLPENSKVVIDATNTVYIDHDVLQLIRDFVNATSKERNIDVQLTGFRKEYKLDNTVATHVTSVHPPVISTDPALADKNSVLQRETAVPITKVKAGVKVPSHVLNLNGSN